MGRFYSLVFASLLLSFAYLTNGQGTNNSTSESGSDDCKGDDCKGGQVDPAVMDMVLKRLGTLNATLTSLVRKVANISSKGDRDQVTTLVATISRIEQKQRGVLGRIETLEKQVAQLLASDTSSSTETPSSGGSATPSTTDSGITEGRIAALEGRMDQTSTNVKDIGVKVSELEGRMDNVTQFLEGNGKGGNKRKPNCRKLFG